MIVQLYSVYDVKTRVYSPPVCCHNDGHAERVFTNVFSDPNHMASKYPEDFKLFSVGSFDDSTAIITMVCNPKFMCNASDLLDRLLKSQKGDNRG